MKSEWMITLLTAGGILILCAAMIIWDKIRQMVSAALKTALGNHTGSGIYPGGT